MLLECETTLKDLWYIGENVSGNNGGLRRAALLIQEFFSAKGTSTFFVTSLKLATSQGQVK